MIDYIVHDPYSSLKYYAVPRVPTPVDTCIVMLADGIKGKKKKEKRKKPKAKVQHHHTSRVT